MKLHTGPRNMGASATWISSFFKILYLSIKIKMNFTCFISSTIILFERILRAHLSRSKFKKNKKSQAFCQCRGLSKTHSKILRCVTTFLDGGFWFFQKNGDIGYGFRHVLMVQKVLASKLKPHLWNNEDLWKKIGAL